MAIKHDWHLYTDAKLIEAVRKLAEQERRSVQAQVEVLLAEALAARKETK